MATIIYILVAFVLGIIITSIFTKSGKNDESKLSELNSDNERLRLKLAEAEQNVKYAKVCFSNKEKEITTKYKALLNEANCQIEKLEQKIKNALAVKPNDSIKNRLAEAEKLEKKIKDLEDELEKAKDNLSNVQRKLKNKDADIANLQKYLGKEQKLSRELTSELSEVKDSIKNKLAETEKLEKKIKDLEDELEEAEDELSDVQRKLKNKDADIVDLQEHLGKEQKLSRELTSELLSIKATLEEKVEELKLKKGSLDFIHEILSAKEISTADSNKLNKKIDIFEGFVKGQFTDINAYLYTTYKLTWNNIEGKAGFENKRKYFHDAFDQWASTKRKSWLDGKTTIAFVGEFNAGKTSIVNRILSKDNPNVLLFPVKNKPTTAIPTYITGGAAVSYSFISGDAKRKTILENTFKKVSKDILDQVKGVSSLIKYFVMTYKNPDLNGLSILDTPGFNSKDSEDCERTIDVINECDALFWVFDVNSGQINSSSVSIIKEKLNKPLYVVINKVNTYPDSEVLKVENLIKKTLSDAGLQVQQFIRFSEKAPLASIMNPIKSVNKIASRDTFVYDVKDDLEQLLKILSDAVRSSNKSYENVCQEGEKITEEIIGCIKNIKSDCDEAYNIPQWVEHLFCRDRFEMSATEGENLKELLFQIADKRIQALAEKFDERVEKAEEIQQVWSDLCDLKAAWQKTKECYEQYQKVSKDIQ